MSPVELNLRAELQSRLERYADCAAAGAWCSAERHAQYASQIACELQRRGLEV